MSDFVVITGLSGAGRSQAADVLEDLGWYIIDNLPPALIGRVADLADAPETARIAGPAAEPSAAAEPAAAPVAHAAVPARFQPAVMAP